MRKLLALTLAMAMVLSLASVAFANPSETGGVTPTTDVPVEPRNPGIKLYEPLLDKYDNPIGSDPVLFGDTVYMGFDFYDVDDNGDPIDGTHKFITTAKMAKELKVSAKWHMGEEYIEDVKIAPHKNQNGVRYCVEIITKEAPEEVDEQDVIGTITLKTSSKYDGFGKEQKYDVAFSLTNDSAGKGYTPSINETGDDYYVYDFHDGEEDHEFNLFGNMGRFVVDTRGQGKLVINTDVDYNKGLEKAAPDVNYVYFNANNATFNKIGTLYLNADYGDHLYRVNKDGTLKEVKAPYDTDEEAFKVRTRTIASYVVSEKELDLDKVNASVLPAESALGASLVGSEVVAPVNPATGAAL